MSDIHQNTVVARAQGFTTAPVNNELMMLNVEQGAYYSLDPIATEIWGMLEQPTHVSELVARLQMRYAVSAEQCLADVLTFLGELYAKGMILLERDSSA